MITDTTETPTVDPEVEVDAELEVSEPNYWLVILHNDNVTTMQFVVEILMKVFHKTVEEATEVMLAIHNNGYGVAGRYTYEIAEEKMNVTLRTAQAYGFPLKASIEEEK